MQIVLLQPFLRYFYTDRGLSEHKTCQYSTTYNLDFHKLAKIQIDENGWANFPVPAGNVSVWIPK